MKFLREENLKDALEIVSNHLSITGMEFVKKVLERELEVFRKEWRSEGVNADGVTIKKLVEVNT